MSKVYQFKNTSLNLARLNKTLMYITIHNRYMYIIK